MWYHIYGSRTLITVTFRAKGEKNYFESVFCCLVFERGEGGLGRADGSGGRTGAPLAPLKNFFVWVLAKPTKIDLAWPPVPIYKQQKTF